jgi:hypothetical protein
VTKPEKVPHGRPANAPHVYALTKEQAIALAKQQKDTFLKVAAEEDCNIILFE